jgi:hypothetical protein
MNDSPYTVESLSDQIGRLVAERQRLRAEDASANVLERNRVAIARAQQVLSELLILRYRPSAAA